MVDPQIGARLVQARKALKKTQEELFDALGIPVSTQKKYEGSHREPGSAHLARLARAGINVNWLLTGVGPVLLADLTPKPAPPLRINVDALAATLDAMRKTAKPGETPEATSRKVARFYAMMVEEEMITEDGIGNGLLKDTG